MKSKWTILALCLFAAASACASDANEANDAGSATPVASDAGAGEDGAAPAEPDAEPDAGRAGECNALEQAGEFVAARSEPGAAPKPAGGVTEDGRYVLESVVLYGTTQAIDYRNKSTLQTVGLTVDVIEDTGRGDSRKTGTGAVRATTLTLTETCAFPSRPLRVERADFTATADRIELFGAVGGGTLVQTFRKL